MSAKESTVVLVGHCIDNELINKVRLKLALAGKTLVLIDPDEINEHNEILIDSGFESSLPELNESYSMKGIYRDNSFRGGSKGKGGKIKYQRK